MGMIKLAIIDECEDEIEVDEDTYRQAKAGGELSEFLDVYLSDLDHTTTLIEPDGMEFDPHRPPYDPPQSIKTVADFIVRANGNDPWTRGRLTDLGWRPHMMLVPGFGAFHHVVESIAPTCDEHAVVVMADGDGVRLVKVVIEAINAPARLSEEGPTA